MIRIGAAGPVDAEEWAETFGMNRSPGMDEREAETKSGRSRRMAVPESVETTTGGIDAFPRTGAAGPGCQAATVALRGAVAEVCFGDAKAAR